VLGLKKEKELIRAKKEKIKLLPFKLFFEANLGYDK